MKPPRAPSGRPLGTSSFCRKGGKAPRSTQSCFLLSLHFCFLAGRNTRGPQDSSRPAARHELQTRALRFSSPVLSACPAPSRRKAPASRGSFSAFSYSLIPKYTAQAAVMVSVFGTRQRINPASSSNPVPSSRIVPGSGVTSMSKSTWPITLPLASRMSNTSA